MGHAVLRQLINKIRDAKYFTVMIDECTDHNISVKEHVSVCIRTVDDGLNISEDFLGLYCPDSTDAKTLYSIIRDCLACTFDLSVENCRGQCYDVPVTLQADTTECRLCCATMNCLSYLFCVTLHSLLRSLVESCFTGCYQKCFCLS